MAMWTDEYCYKSECIYSASTTAGWMYYGPKYDAQFTESVSSLVSYCLFMTKRYTHILDGDVPPETSSLPI